jgi:hypothetical protein
MAKKQNAPSSLIVSLALPAILLAAYAAFNRLKPSEAQQEVALLREDIERVKASEVSPEARAELSEKLEAQRKDLKQLTDRLDTLRQQAGRLMQGQLDSFAQLRLEGDLSRILSNAGLQLVHERPAETNNTSSGLLKSLEVATKQLGDNLTKIAAAEADNTPIDIPPDLSPDINPLEWIAEQRRLRSGNFAGPSVLASDLRLVGDYQAMLEGLETLIATCPEVMVTGIGFEMPSVTTPGVKPLIWNVQIQMRPMNRPLDDAGSFANRQSQSTYVVTKPPLGPQEATPATRRSGFGDAAESQ